MFLAAASRHSLMGVWRISFLYCLVHECERVYSECIAFVSRARSFLFFLLHHSHTTFRWSSFTCCRIQFSHFTCHPANVTRPNHWKWKNRTKINRKAGLVAVCILTLTIPVPAPEAKWVRRILKSWCVLPNEPLHAFWSLLQTGT